MVPQQPDLLNQLIIPLGADLVLFVLKAVIITLLAGFFFKKYITPIFKKEDQGQEQNIVQDQDKDKEQ